MAFDKDNTKVINNIFIEPDTHLWLLMQANKAGMDLRYFAGMLLDRAKTEYRSGSESDNDAVAVFDLLQHTRAKKAMVENVYVMASIYLDGHMQDVEMAEHLAAACERAGLDYDEVLRTSVDNPFSSLAQYEIAHTKMGECVQWLSGFIAEHKEVPSKVIYSLANSQGFTEKTVRRATAYINNHNQGYKIHSKRTSHGWSMTLLKDDEQQENTLVENFFNRTPKIEFEESG